MLEGTLLHAGYLLNELEREIHRKMVVCQLNNRVLWQFELQSETGAAPVVTMEPTPPQPQKPRFVVKTSADAKKLKAKKAKAGE
jgi:hypothetical protein